MDYEKEYKKLKAGISKAYLYAQTDSTKAVLENILSELTENEDERTRRSLIDAIKIGCSNSGISFTKEAADRYIAWLEKQEENTWSEEDDAKVKVMCEEGDLKPSERAWLKDLKNRVWKEQKSAEWSKEDESFLDSIEEAIHSYYDLNHASQYDYWLEEKLKSLRPQPKPEWSEEDEKMLRTIISDGSRGVELDSKQISWLKSLRPVSKESLQPHWKPSEEQMNAFKKYIEEFQARAEAAVGGWNNFDVMIRLYEQLKKL